MNTDLAAQRAIDHLNQQGFEAASESERVLATAWLFAAGVSNRGFSGYYSSKKGDLAFFAPTALRLISAPQLASLAEQANSVFGPEGPPRLQQVRRARLLALPGSARAVFTPLEHRYFECAEDVDDLMETYMTQRAALP